MEYEIRSTNTNDYNQLLNNSSSFILSTFKDETEEVEWKFKNMRVVSPDDCNSRSNICSKKSTLYNLKDYTSSVNSSGINRRL
ncbi:6412_t:CDS:2 [Entrophospora sp. SA101]|nr:6103_t:CDS:2 [Entrophospora sp. SA101]CAJ0756080.1 6412_t:CDS:2 [Entrophospora sp. SA101]